MAKTALQQIYDKYESFRYLKTAKEHGDRFLSWFLIHKEELLEKEKQQIVKSYQNCLDQTIVAGNTGSALLTSDEYFTENYE